jgi:hypothetical protein
MLAINRLAAVTFSKYNNSSWFPNYYTTPNDEAISTIINLTEAEVIDPS